MKPNQIESILTKVPKRNRFRKKQVDWWWFFAVILIIVWSIIMIYSWRWSL